MSSTGVSAPLRRLWNRARPARLFVRRTPEFWLLLAIRQAGFIRPPRDRQRGKLISRVFRECADELRHMHEIAPRFVRGSKRSRYDASLDRSPAHYDDGQLSISGHQVMMEWERPLMAAMAEVVTEAHGDVLEIGFGMGISASYIQERGARSHTIVECNDDVIAQLHRWRARYPDRDIRIVKGKWQDVVQELAAYDGIFYDTYATTEEERGHVTSMFFPVAASLLRPGGVLTYYTHEIDSLSRKHQRHLLEHFREFSVRVVRSLRPPEDCQYWWADSMAVVKALK